MNTEKTNIQKCITEVHKLTNQTNTDVITAAAIIALASSLDDIKKELLKTNELLVIMVKL